LLGSFSTKLPLVFVTHLHLDIHKCSARQVEPAKTAFGTEMLNHQCVIEGARCHLACRCFFFRAFCAAAAAAASSA